MPTYQSICLKCNTRHEYIAQMRHAHETPLCCGQITEKRIFDAPMGVMDYPAA
jgi:predicted nucleic acid-binding Zn ribbon protein